MLIFIILIIILIFLGIIYIKTQDASLIAAIGTIFVALSAIWGEKIRSVFASPVLKIKPHNFKGDKTEFRHRGTGKKIKDTIFYHLIVENKRKWVTARNVRVLCAKVSRKSHKGKFIEDKYIVPPQLIWSPAELSQVTPHIRNKKILDLGHLDKNSCFKFSIYWKPNNFNEKINPKETVRIELEINADNFYSKTPYTIEIYWDGIWDDNIDDMENHLSIKTV